MSRWPLRSFISGLFAAVPVMSAGAQPSSELPRPNPGWVSMRPFWAKRLTGYLTTRDGQELRYSVLLPEGAGPFPTLLHYNGYDAGSIGGVAYLAGDATYPRTLDKQLVDAGYAIIGVNARATGCSTGDSLDWLRPLYGQDGYDAVEFAASQSWSTGNVGMYSWSWAGMSQLWTASFRPPHLKAIAPASSSRIRGLIVTRRAECRNRS